MSTTRSERHAHWVATAPSEQTLVLDAVTVAVGRDHNAACLIVDGQEIDRQDVAPSMFFPWCARSSPHQAQHDRGIWPPK